MGRLSDEWEYDELKPRPAKDREKAAKKIASLPYEEAVKEMEKLHSEFNINDHNDISRRVMEKTKGNPDNYGKKSGYEVVNDKSIDAIKDNFTPPGAKDEVDMTIYKEDEDRFGKEALKGLTGPRESEQLKDEEGNPQSEVRYTSPEELKLSEMSEEDLKQGLEDIKRGVTDYTDAEEPVITGWIKDELVKRKSKPKDEMADFQKSLDDYVAKNPKGRDDIPVATRR